MPKIDVSSPTGMVMKDGVVTRNELKRLGATAAAKAAPDKLAQWLDAHLDRMTPGALEAYRLYKSRLSPEAPGTLARQSPLGALLGTEVSQPMLPGWVPAGFDINTTVNGARGVLEAQGEAPESIGPGLAKRMVFCDADLTLLNTTTPTLLKCKTTGEWARYPDSGRLVMLGVGPERDSAKDLAALKAKFPQVDWDQYAPDYSEFGSLTEVLHTKPIPRMVEELRRAGTMAGSRDFIVTARSDATTVAALDEWLTNQNVNINGIFAVNDSALAGKLGVDHPTLTSAQKKALVMVGLIKLYDPEGVWLNRVRFIDDTDGNLVAAMQLLPQMFPKIRFEFADVVHSGLNTFHQVLAAKTGEGHELVDARGKPLSITEIDSYRSLDVAKPLDPDLIHLPG